MRILSIFSMTLRPCLLAFCVAATCLAPRAGLAVTPLGSGDTFASLLDADLLNATGVTGGSVTANFDGSGYAYAGELFPEFGQTVDAEGVPFLLQRTPEGHDHLKADGQSLTLPANTQRLYFLGSSSMGSAMKKIVFVMDDGTTRTASIFISNWCSRQSMWGDHELFPMTYRYDPTAADRRHTIKTSLWATELEVPEGASAIVFLKGTGLSLFAITADSGKQPAWTLPAQATVKDRIPSLSNPLPAAAPVIGRKHVGFVVHAQEEGFEEYPATGSTSMLMNLFFWNMRDEDNQLVNFTPAEDWLAYLYRTGLLATVIIDTSIHHTSIPFRSEATRKLGENVHWPDGSQSEWSSPWSPRYREMVTQYIEDLTGWIKRNDTEGRVWGYVDGAEVFWPGLLDYGPLAMAEFQKYLVREYGSLEAINERWGASFDTVEAIKPLPFMRQGQSPYSPATFVYGKVTDGSWRATVPDYQIGARYEVSAEVKASDVVNNMVQAELVWADGDGKPLMIDVIDSASNTHGQWQQLQGVSMAPEGAKQCFLQLSLKSSGQVRWRYPVVTRLNGKENLVKNAAMAIDNGQSAPRDWQPIAWTGEINLTTETGDKGETVLVMSSPAKEYPVKYPAAAWHDFNTFSIEGYAQTMNHWANVIRKNDPSRLVMHYLGFVLGTLCQWDDLSLTNRPDIFLMNAGDVDVNGLQVATAKGDFHFATAVLDLARKYGKPMVATDLQDFTYGVYVGFSVMNRSTLACVAHGMDGSYYYNWCGYPADYTWFRTWTPDATARMIGNLKQTADFLEGAQLQTNLAFLLPILPYSEVDPGGQKSDQLDVMGWYKMINQAGFIADLYTPYELRKWKDNPLTQYKIMIAPDCPALPVAVVTRLWEFVEQGGTLVLGGRPPVVDETGRALDRPFTPEGLHLDTEHTTTRVMGETTAQIGLAPMALDSLKGQVELAGDATLFGTNNQWPGVVMKEYGQGRIIWTGGMDGRGYLGRVRRYSVAGNTPPMFMPDGDWTWPREEGHALLSMVRELMAKTGSMPVVRVEPYNPNIETAIYRLGDEWRVVLIHSGYGMSWKGKLVFSQSRPGEPTVLADFDPRPVKVTFNAAGEAEVPLPAFEDSCLVKW